MALMLWENDIPIYDYSYSLDPNIVMNVQQLGYSLHGRTIRPAKVGVSKK